MADIKLMDERISFLEEQLKYKEQALEDMGQRTVEYLHQIKTLKAPHCLLLSADFLRV